MSAVFFVFFTEPVSQLHVAINLSFDGWSIILNLFVPIWQIGAA